jgi:hypothetical protein
MGESIGKTVLYVKGIIRAYPFRSLSATAHRSPPLTCGPLFPILTASVADHARRRPFPFIPVASGSTETKQPFPLSEAWMTEILILAAAATATLLVGLLFFEFV